ncbi:MAG TPA: four helix bundle protein [Anaerolineae bacterium]|nr:four helix bundle protein [Anaerolineae bacterium]
MNKITSHDIQKRTFLFAVRIVKLVDRLPRSVAAVEIGRQLLRAGTSVGANVREADGASTHKDFSHKINIAEREAKETHYWNYCMRSFYKMTPNSILYSMKQTN